MNKFSILTVSVLSMGFLSSNLYALKLPGHAAGAHPPGHAIHNIMGRVEARLGRNIDLSNLTPTEFAVVSKIVEDNKGDTAKAEFEISQHLKKTANIQTLNAALKAWTPPTLAEIAGGVSKAAPAGANSNALAAATGVGFRASGKKDTHKAGTGENLGAPIGIAKSEFTSKLSGTLSAAEAGKLWDSFYGEAGTLKEMTAEQVDLAIRLITAKKARGEALNDTTIAADFAAVHTESLGLAEVSKLENDFRLAIDNDPVIKGILDAATKGTPAQNVFELGKLVDDVEGFHKADVTYSGLIKGKIEAARSAIANYEASPSKETLSLAREAVEELVATKQAKYKDVCGVCPCK